MRATITIILLATATLTACGKNNRNGSNGNGMSRQGAFLECSYAQVRKQCLDYSDNKRIPPRFFYYRQCHEEYKSCLRGFGY